MRKLFDAFYWWFIAAALFIATLQVHSASVVTATITVTNTPSNGNTFAIGSARTWTNSVSSAATQILIGGDVGGSATNLYNQIAANPYSPPLLLGFSSSNVITMRSGVGVALAPTASGTWCTITLVTNAAGGQYAAMLPGSALSNQARTNEFSDITTGLNSYSQVALSETATATGNLLNKGQTQTATGAKTFLSITTSNLVNVGSAVSSQGSGSASEQFGTGATATAVNALAVGQSATSSGVNSAAIGNGASATTTTNGLAIGNFASVSRENATAVGTGASASGKAGVAVGSSASASATNAVAIGTSSDSSFANSVALGNGATATAANQVRLGTATENVSVPGTITGTLTGSTVSNITHRGQQTFTSDEAFTRVNITSLANGNNAGVDFGSDTVYAKIKPGPSAAFTLNGIAGGRNGRVLELENATGQTWTIAADSGVDATPGNRIYTTPTGGSDVASVTFARLKYDSEISRWKLDAVSPSAAVSLANPSSSVSLSANNGVLTTALRSDATPALSQSIAPTWSALHQFIAGTAHLNNTVTLTSDNQVVSITGDYLILNSDNGTAGNRTFLIGAGLGAAGYGQTLVIEWQGTNAGELVDDSTTGGHAARLSATWTPTQYDTLTLHYNGTDWLELSRSTN